NTHRSKASFSTQTGFLTGTPPGSAPDAVGGSARCNAPVPSSISHSPCKTRAEKGKGQAPPELPAKRPPVRIPLNDNEDLIEANRLTIIGRLTNPQMQKPIRAITEVELEYIKIEKHCFSCFSLLHEEGTCPYRPYNALPPKERALGITQRIALQRIEAEKKRHDDRRGYRRPDEARSFSRYPEDSYAQAGRVRGDERSSHFRRDDHGRDQSILSRTARPISEYSRSKASTPQYRVVERNRPSSASSTPQAEGADLRTTLPPHTTKTVPPIAEVEITPTRTIKDRLGDSSKTKANSNSGSKDRRSALERLSASEPAKEISGRRAPSFESGRLQIGECRGEEEVFMEEEQAGEPITGAERVPAPLRLGTSGAETRSRRGVIPVATQSKVASKRRVISSTRKRVLRSPRLGITQKKSTADHPSTTTRRKLNVDKDNELPCNKK
ncbi:hypothetical protein HID58_037664, partial [Brassica napus]